MPTMGCNNKINRGWVNRKDTFRKKLAAKVMKHNGHRYLSAGLNVHKNFSKSASVIKK